MTTPEPPFDDRDPRVAAWLAVDPLDDVTRSRLVRTALAAAPDRAPKRDRRRASIVGVAAALLVLVLVGLAALVPRDDDTLPTAVDAPPATGPSAGSRRADDSAAAGTAASPEALAETVAPLVLPSLGDVGDASTPRRLERVATAGLPRPDGSQTITVSGCAASAGRAFGTPVAAGSGRIDGRRAVVIVAEQPSGVTAVVAVRGRTCGRAVSVLLP